jgi:hypothetical protein
VTEPNPSAWQMRKITLGADAIGKPVEVLVVDEEVSRLLDERSRYWAAQSTPGKGPIMAALAELVWAGRQEGLVADMFGGPGPGWALKLRSTTR